MFQACRGREGARPLAELGVSCRQGFTFYSLWVYKRNLTRERKEK